MCLRGNKDLRNQTVTGRDAKRAKRVDRVLHSNEKADNMPWLCSHFLESVQGIFSLTNPEKLSVFKFPRMLKNLFPDSSMWLIMPLTIVSKTVFSAGVRSCEPLLSSSPSGIHHFLGLGIAKRPGKI